MSRVHKILSYFIIIFLVSGCSLIDVNQRQNTKKNITQTVFDNNQPEPLKLYSNDSKSSYETSDIQDLSNYIISDDKENVQEVTNIVNPIKRELTFNSNLKVINKKFDNKKVKIAIEEMPLNKFLNLVFGKVLNVDYVLDKNVQKDTTPVSINLKNKISKKDFFRIITDMLEEFNVVVTIEDNIFYIKKAKRNSAKSVYKIYLGETLPKNLDDQQIIYMMRPYFYNKHLGKYSLFVKKYFLSKNGKVELDKYENIIKLQDKVANIRKALRFYSFMDQPTLRNKKIKLVHLDNIDVKDFIKQLESILKGYGIPISKDIRSFGVQFIPIKQINSFLLISEKDSWSKTVLFWKDKLDVVEENVAENGFYVYTPKNRKASELVSVLNQFKESYKEPKKSKINKKDTPNLQNNTSNISIKQEFKIVEDKDRNNIIIYGTKAEYANVLKMLKKLDTLPKQVLIEVTIAEITLRDSMQFGLEWFLKTRGDKYGLTFTALGAGSAGIAGILSTKSGDFGASFNALQTNKYVNVLSDPKLLVLNNHSANINVGNQVPIVSSQATATDLASSSTTQPSVLQNIEYRSTGIQLSVKPTINSKGYLTLTIHQNVSNAQANDTSSISSPLIFNRSISTDVLLKSGEIVVLGGLITENKSKDKTELPFLGSIPILGHLFSTSSDSIDKTELVIMVKPTIINSNSEARAVTDTLLDLMDFD